MLQEISRFEELAATASSTEACATLSEECMAACHT